MSLPLWNDGQRGRREAARQGDEKAQLITQSVIDLFRRERLERVFDAEANPIGAYLTILEWISRFESVVQRRCFRGKTIPRHTTDAEEDARCERGNERYIEQMDALENLRDKVLIEGCHLGSSPVEMSRVLERIKSALSKLELWFDIEDNAAASDELALASYRLSARLAPLKDLLKWKRAVEAGAAKVPPGAESLESQALQVLLSNPAITFTELARVVGCSRRTLYNLPRVMAAQQARQRGRLERRKGYRTTDGGVEAIDG